MQVIWVIPILPTQHPTHITSKTLHITMLYLTNSVKYPIIAHLQNAERFDTITKNTVNTVWSSEIKVR